MDPLACRAARVSSWIAFALAWLALVGGGDSVRSDHMDPEP